MFAHFPLALNISQGQKCSWGKEVFVLDRVTSGSHDGRFKLIQLSSDILLTSAVFLACFRKVVYCQWVHFFVWTGSWQCWRRTLPHFNRFHAQVTTIASAEFYFHCHLLQDSVLSCFRFVLYSSGRLWSISPPFIFINLSYVWFIYRCRGLCWRIETWWHVDQCLPTPPCIHPAQKQPYIRWSMT